MTDLRYPVGPFRAPGEVTTDQRRQWIETIAATPEKLRRAIEGLTDAQLDTPYRPGGWTVRQVVAHLTTSTRTGWSDIIVGAIAARGNFDRMERDRARRLAGEYSAARDRFLLG